MIDGNQTLRVEVAHASPGRARLRLRPEDLESPALRKAERALAVMPGILSVRLNARARSLVITYADSVGGLERLLDELRQAGVDVVRVPRENIVLNALPTVSSVGTAGQFGRRGLLWNRGRNRRGVARLRTVIPVAIVAVAIRAVVTGGQVSVPWYLLAALVVSSALKPPKEEPTPT